jgi:hypothetical protein
MVSNKNGVCGPSFVCVYVGQSSIHYNELDYSNDSFDFKCDENRNQLVYKDFSEDALAHEKYQYLGLISKSKHI